MKIIALLTFFTGIMTSLYAQPLVLATYQYADNDRIANIQPLADYLTNVLQRKVETKSYASVHLFMQGIQNNEVDIALMNTFGYLLLDAASKPYAMKPVVVLTVKEGTQDNYKTAIIAQKDFPADTLLALGAIAAGYRLGLVNTGSTSGNLVPRLALNAVGITEAEKQFKTVFYGGNHKTTTDALLEGRADICAVGSTEYFSAMADPGKASRIKLLWLSPEIPLGPVLLHNRLESGLREKITRVLLELHQTRPEVLSSVKNGWSEAKQAEKYIPANAGYYTPFRRQLGDEKSMEKILRQFAN